jgi:hypothetical protein
MCFLPFALLFLRNLCSDLVLISSLGHCIFWSLIF